MKRTILCIVSTTLMFSVTIIGRVHSQSQTQRPGWSSQHPGLIELARALRAAGVSEQDVIPLIPSLSRVSDRTLSKLAKHFGRNQDLSQLSDGLRRAADRGGISPQVDCIAESNGYFVGCLLNISAGSIEEASDICADQSNAYECTCEGGAYLGNGFCYNY